MPPANTQNAINASNAILLARLDERLIQLQKDFDELRVTIGDVTSLKLGIEQLNQWKSNVQWFLTILGGAFLLGALGFISALLTNRIELIFH